MLGSEHRFSRMVTVEQAATVIGLTEQVHAAVDRLAGLGDRQD